MSTPTTSVRISVRLAARLERAAARLSRGKSWLVTQALREYLAKVDRGDLAVEARRQSLLVARRERGRRADRFWEGDATGWK